MELFIPPMSELLPRKSPVENEPGESRLVRLEEGGDEVLSVLNSETARAVLAALHDEPMAPSDLADLLDTSIQTVSYHLRNLTEADLVRVIDNWYSAKGREMDVYAPTTEALVIVMDETVDTPENSL